MIPRRPVCIAAGHVPGWNPDPRRQTRGTAELDEHGWNQDVVERCRAMNRPEVETLWCSGGAGSLEWQNACSIYDRVQWANECGASGYIEVHHDIGGGNHVLLLVTSPAGRALADVIEGHVSRVRGQWAGPTMVSTVGGDSGYKKIAVLSAVRAPAVVIECAGMDLAPHDVYFQRAAFRETLAAALVAAAREWAT